MWLLDREALAWPSGVPEQGQMLRQPFTPAPLDTFMTLWQAADTQPNDVWEDGKQLAVYKKEAIKVPERGSQWW